MLLYTIHSLKLAQCILSYYTCNIDTEYNFNTTIKLLTAVICKCICYSPINNLRPDSKPVGPLQSHLTVSKLATHFDVSAFCMHTNIRYDCVMEQCDPSE